MNILIRRAQTEWPAWLAVAFVALLPFRRLSEIPLSILAISLLFLLRSDRYKTRVKSLLPLLLPLFLCFWLPMVFSSFDSYDPQKSWITSLAAVRYFMAALSIGVLLHSASLRWLVLRWCSYLLIFWAVDGYIQIPETPGLGIELNEKAFPAKPIKEWRRPILTEADGNITYQ